MRPAWARSRSPTRVRRSRSRPTACASPRQADRRRSTSSVPTAAAGQRLAPFESVAAHARADPQDRRLVGQRHPLSRGRGRVRGRAGHGQPVDAHARRHRRLRGPRAAGRRHAPAAAGGGARARGGDAARADLRPPARVRVVLGPQDDHFTQAGLATLLGSPTRSPPPTAWACGSRGPRSSIGPRATTSSPTASPRAPSRCRATACRIVLLADRQTTGGYPKVATVISADLPALGRMTPGAKIAFAAVDIETAEAAARALALEIADLPSRMAPAPRNTRSTWTSCSART